jgi:hypothetical protein
LSLFYIILIAASLFLALLLGPLLFGRLFMPKLTLSMFRRFGKWGAKVLNRIKPDLDLKLMVKAGNRYFRSKFAATPFKQRVLFIPFCLRPLDCPTEVSPDEGLICPADCPGCPVGQLKKQALDMGYGAVYIVPSSRMMKGKGLLPSDKFIGRKLKEHSPGAALGVVCTWHLRNRLLKNHSVGSKGFPPEGDGPKSVVQGVLLDSRNCKQSSVNMEEVRRVMAITVQDL